MQNKCQQRRAHSKQHQQTRSKKFPRTSLNPAPTSSLFPWTKKKLKEKLRRPCRLSARRRTRWRRRTSLKSTAVETATPWIHSNHLRSTTVRFAFRRTRWRRGRSERSRGWPRSSSSCCKCCRGSLRSGGSGSWSGASRSSDSATNMAWRPDFRSWAAKRRGCSS